MFDIGVFDHLAQYFRIMTPLLGGHR